MVTNMTPVDWAKRPIVEKYADFSGRAPRAEYWWYALAMIVAFLVIGIVESILGIKHMIFGVYGPISALLLLATIVPSLAVGIRRLHDTNRSGWWIAMPLIPYALAFALGGAGMLAGGGMASLGIAAIFLFIGGISALVLLVFYCLAGTPGDNRYGPNPYGDAMGVVAAE